MLTLAGKIADAIQKYHTGFMKKKVLKTPEELEANTDENSLVAAPVIAKLNADMGGLRMYEDELGNKYVVGADSVPKKLGSGLEKMYVQDFQDGNKTFSCPSRPKMIIFVFNLSGDETSNPDRGNQTETWISKELNGSDSDIRMGRSIGLITDITNNSFKLSIPWGGSGRVRYWV